MAATENVSSQHSNGEATYFLTCDDGSNEDEPTHLGSPDEESTQEGLQQIHHKYLYMPLRSANKTKKAEKSSRRKKNDWSIQDSAAELDLIEWYKDNTYLWLITDQAQRGRKTKALEDKAMELGLTAEHINAWWKSNRDNYTKLSKKKSGVKLTDLTYKQRWILQKFAFLNRRPKMIAALAQQHPGDLQAVESATAEEGHSQHTASSSRHNAKSRSEEADFKEELFRRLEESPGITAGKMKSASTFEDDYLTQWGRTVVASMRRMSKRRRRACRRDVDNLLHKYSPTSSEDDTYSPLRKTVRPPETASPCTFVSELGMGTSLS
ncbi:uncharacterized protein [Asterias amurensis]|uniref:uncharacterized protein n=1 Tax=Asterias amurensis TaxID=7602 RepID=UPI003AB325C2